MTTDEKLPLVQDGRPPIENVPRRRPWKIVAVVAGLALLARFGLHSHSHSHSSHGHHGKHGKPGNGPTVPQCPQVEPLFPIQKSDALAEMDDYIASAAFHNATIARMAGAVQIPTQSYDDMGVIGEDKRWDIMYDLAAYLEKTFPLVYGKLKYEKVNTHGLLLTWQGTDASLKPTVLMAHQDVVPVAETTVAQWTYPPWSGAFDGKHIWGRGASDCKNQLIGIMEAVELLIDASFEPKRTLILSFGFDEEISGAQGAGHLAPFLFERYGKDGVGMIIDEGMGIAEAWGTYFAQPAVGEKGYIDVEIIVRMPGGHSSIPPAHNGIGVMSELVTMIEANPYEPRFNDENPFLGLLQCGAAHAPEFPPKLKKMLSKHKEAPRHKKDKLAHEAAKMGDAVKYLFTTSLAPDVISGGVKNNALPERTRLLVNHRVNVGDRTSDVQDNLAVLAKTVAEKYNLTVHAFTDEAETPGSISLKAEKTVLESAPVTPTSVDGITPYAVLSGTTRALYGTDVLMAPGLSTGNTDTRFYWDLTQHIFRYGPGWDPEDMGLGAIHTVNEKISLKNHVHTVQWFSMFVRNIDEADMA